MVVIAGLHRQKLRCHGWKGKRFWYLNAFKMRRKVSKQNICLYCWLITAVFHRERGSWPSLVTDTGNITTDEAVTNVRNKGFHRIMNTGDGRRNSHSMISEEPMLHLTLICRVRGTQRPLQQSKASCPWCHIACSFHFVSNSSAPKAHRY